MSTIYKNQRGFAIVYGLVVLVLATVAGTGLLVMTRQGRTGAGDYGNMRIVSQAALAACKACEGQFLDDPETALDILKKFKEDPSNKWLLGGPADAGSEQRVTLGSFTGASEYSACIVGFDETNYMIKIEGTGYGSNGGKKKVTAAYELQGLGRGNIPYSMPFGIFLGGQLENCNEPIHIDGDVYLSGKGLWGPDNQHFNQGGTINGNFKTAVSTNYLDIGQNLRITGNAFMQMGCWPNSGVFTVEGKAGFTYNFKNMNGSLSLKDDAYFRPTSNLPSANKVVGTAGHTVKYRPPATADRFTGFGTETSVAGLLTTDIANDLGMTTADELPMGYKLPTWGAGVVESVAGENYNGDLSAATVENYWTTHRDNGTLFQNEWLVMQLTHNIKITGGDFTRKAIWITGDYQLDGNGNFFNCSDESNTLIIVNGSGNISSMGPPNNGNFRGAIYVNTSYDYAMIYQFGSNSNFYGAIHHASETKFNINSGGADTARVLLTHPLAQTAMQEIVNTGIILSPGLTTPPERELALLDIKIRPRLLCMQM